MNLWIQEHREYDEKSNRDEERNTKLVRLEFKLSPAGNVV